MFIIQLLQVSKSTSVSNKTEQLSSTKIHMKGFSFLALLTAILVQVRFLLKTSAQNPVSGSYSSKDISQLYQVPWHPETNQLWLCSLSLLYIPYALNYSPITKNPQHLNLHTGSSSLPAVQDIPKSWHLRRSQPGREGMR